MEEVRIDKIEDPGIRGIVENCEMLLSSNSWRNEWRVSSSRHQPVRYSPPSLHVSFPSPLDRRPEIFGKLVFHNVRIVFQSVCDDFFRASQLFVFFGFKVELEHTRPQGFFDEAKDTESLKQKHTLSNS